LSRYPLPAIALHWLHAAFIAALLALGWTMVELPKGAERSAAIGLHKSLGLTALLVVGLRLAVRRRHPMTELSGTALERRLARTAHGALYVLLAAAPLAGYLASSFTSYPMKFFGLALPKAGWPDAALNGLFNGAHKAAAWALAAMIVLHVLAALRHALRRDGVMSRMLPVSGRDSCSVSEQPARR
jgi:cytochrome b561